MSYKKREFANKEIYHLVLRGLDNNLIFKDEDDYYRGIFSVYEFNNEKPIKIRERRKTNLKSKKRKTITGTSYIEVDDREKLVDVLAFCFMPDHVHLLVRQLKEGGITKFMRKVGTGYGSYFNKKYGRRGYVFQNRFASAHVKDGIQLRIVFVYIHASPASLVEAGLKERGIENPPGVLKFLLKYKWSSYPDYLSKKNFPTVTERRSILSEMGGGEGCKKAVSSWIKYKSETSKFPDLASLILESTQDGPV
ncbi:MAG: transposase [Candidatus Nealsonbacteria bacterium]|nr:transposase [Candidatus Nealsonbacteria bacterium]